MIAIVQVNSVDVVTGTTIEATFSAQGSWGPKLFDRVTVDLSSSLSKIGDAIRAKVIAWAALPQTGLVTLTPSSVQLLGIVDDQITGVRKVADDVTSSLNFADVPGLVFQLAPNSHYKFKFKGAYTTAVATTALQLSVNGPANPSFMRAVAELFTTPSSVFGFAIGAYDATVNPATGAGATPLPFELEGTISTGNAGGALALRYRSEVNGSAVTILRGSFGELISVG